MEMKEVVVKICVHDNREKSKAMKAVSALPGIDSISMDMEEQKMTVIGIMDPVDVVEKLRKRWRAEIVSVGPPKEPEKKEEPKKPEEKVKTDVHACELYPKPELIRYLPPPRFFTEYEEYPSRCVIC